ncbi:MAG: flagellar motor switch protein FliN [Candidatus Gastranaerophilales bacterium]|nr:flagellar motor switch protein FliN [Candidatus Gastranaerophilales bacterium]
MEDKEINSQDFSAEDFNDIENQEILAQNMQSMESSLFEENANEDEIDSVLNAKENDNIKENNNNIEENIDELEKPSELPTEEELESQNIENNIENDFSKEEIIEENKIKEEFQQEEIKENIAQEKQIKNIAPLISDNEEFEEPIEKMVTVRPVKFQEFENTPPVCSIKKNLDIMQDITLHVSVELGRTKSSIKEVMEMEKGSIVELDKIAGEQVEIYANEKLVAKGEVIVIEDKFGVRVTSTNLANPNQNY